jgi:hypothetical protein
MANRMHRDRSPPNSKLNNMPRVYETSLRLSLARTAQQVQQHTAYLFQTVFFKSFSQVSLALEQKKPLCP